MMKFSLALILLCFCKGSSCTCVVPRSCDFNGMGCQQTNDLKETNNGLIRYNFSRNININGIMITYDITEASTTNQLSLGISSSSLMYTTRTISLSMARDLDVNVTYADVSWVVMNISFIGANLVFSVSFNCDPSITQTSPSDNKEECPPTATTQVNTNSKLTGTASTILLTTLSTTTQDKHSSSNISSVIIGVAVSIGILLSLLTAAICVLSIVVLISKRNKKSSSVPPYSGGTASGQTANGPHQQPSDQYEFNSLPQYTPWNVSNELTEANLQFLSSEIQYFPQAGGGLVSLDEWKRKVELEQMEEGADSNPLYAGSVCGSEIGVQPPEYATVAEANREYSKHSSNLLHFAQLNNTSQAHGNTTSLNRLALAEVAAAHSDLNSQVSLSLAKTAARRADLEYSDSGSSEDEAAVNCHYEATQFMSTSNTCQVGDRQSSIYELMESDRTIRNNDSMDADCPTTDNVASATDEQALDNTSGETKMEVCEEDSNTTQVSGMERNDDERAVVSHSVDEDLAESEVQDDDKGSVHASIADRDDAGPQSMGSKDDGDNNEVLCEESLYDDPTCLGKYNVSAI